MADMWAKILGNQTCIRSAPVLKDTRAETARVLRGDLLNGQCSPYVNCVNKAVISRPNLIKYSLNMYVFCWPEKLCR